MSETLLFSFGIEQRAERYSELIPQFQSLIEGERDEIAVLANASAALYETFQFHWVGFYLVKENELVLGPFQGPIACTRIGYGKGVCGTAWSENKSQLVPDVDAFPGHIACSIHSRSELVLPLRDASGKVKTVLDIDSSKLDDFSVLDLEELSRFCSIIEKQIYL